MNSPALNSPLGAQNSSPKFLWVVGVLLSISIFAPTLFLAYNSLDFHLEYLDREKALLDLQSNQENLFKVLVESNIPGNRIFESQNVTQERLKLTENHQSFQKIIHEMRQAMDKERLILSDNSYKSIDQIKLSYEEHYDAALSVLNLYERYKFKEASIEMSKMDQAFHMNLKAFEAFSHSLHAELSLSLSKYLMMSQSYKEKLLPINILSSLSFILLMALLGIGLKKLKTIEIQLSEKVDTLSLYEDILQKHSIISRTNESGLITYANDNFCTISKYSLQELKGKNHNILRSGEHDKKFFEDMWSVISSGEIWRGKIKNKAKDGSFYWVDSTISPVKNIKKQIIGYLSIRYDITNEVESGIKQIKLTEFFQNILEAFDEGYLICQEDGVIVSQNSSSKQIIEKISHPLSMFNIKNFFDKVLIYTDERVLNQQDFFSYIISLKNLPYKGIIGLKTDHNEIEWLDLKVSKFYQEDFQSQPRYLFTFNKISDLINGKIQILETKNALKLAQKVALLGSWEYSPLSQEYFLSDQGKILLGVSPEEQNITSAHYQRYINPEDLPSYRQTLEDSFKNHSSYQIRYRILIDENFIWVEEKGQWDHHPNNNVIYLHGTIQDISRIVQMETDLLIESQKSLQSSKLATLGEMSASMAHEINNPLSIIQGTAGLLKKSLHDPVEFSTKVEKILKAVERISKIVKGLRKFSRTAESVDKNIHSLANLIQESIILVQGKIQNRQIEIVQKIDENLEIYVNEIEFEQVIINLINNAADAIKDLPQKWIEITGYLQNNQVHITITDSGSGVPKNVRDKIFNPFFTTKTIGEGTGLGMSIAKGIIEEHGGKIWIEESSAHTQFCIALPQIITSKNTT